MAKILVDKDFLKDIKNLLNALSSDLDFFTEHARDPRPYRRICDIAEGMADRIEEMIK